MCYDLCTIENGCEWVTLESNPIENTDIDILSNPFDCECEDEDEYKDDPYCDDDEDYYDEDNDENENNEELTNENNKIMNLQVLREKVRSYKGLISVENLIKKDFADCYKEFTPELVKEFLGEITSEGNMIMSNYFVTIIENRLYHIDCFYPWNYSVLYKDGKKEYDNMLIQLCTTLRGVDTDKVFRNNYSGKLSNVYLIEDYSEVISLENAFKADELKKEQERIQKEIKEKEELVADMKKYKLSYPDQYKIERLKAVEIIRNPKATAEEVVDALHKF